MFLSFLVLLYLREGDVGCQIAKGGCKGRNVEIG